MSGVAEAAERAWWCACDGVEVEMGMVGGSERVCRSEGGW